MSVYYFLGCLWFMMPAYIANMAPIFVKNYFKFLAKPIDFGKKFKGKEILGAHKTFRGLIFGCIASILMSSLQFLLYKYPFFKEISIVSYTEVNYLLLGFLLGFGALFGDMVKSFFKRRINIKPGARWIPFDQLDYVLGALLFSLVIFVPSFASAIIIIASSFLLHIIANHIGYYLKIREEKW